LQARNVLDFGPSKIVVFDFDERQVQAVKRFADRERLENLDAELYNCFDAFPARTKFDCFYTNPPWGASNGGESVNVFVERGIEAIGGVGDGMIVIADDDELPWPKEVLGNVQQFASRQGFYVSRMQRKLHGYHLDDAPDLKSCNLFISSLRGNVPLERPSQPISKDRRMNFYGRSQELRVRYVRERKRLDYGKASDEEYSLDLLENGK
jgi:predicted methyltransferase